MIRKILFCIFMGISIVWADKVIIASDNWCPFNCEPSSEIPEYMVEIAKSAFTAQGHTFEGVSTAV